MKVEQTNNLKIKLNGKDADLFKSAINKISKPDIGFSIASISNDEQKLFNQLSKKLNQ